MASCSVRDIVNRVVSEDKDSVEAEVKKWLKANDLEIRDAMLQPDVFVSSLLNAAGVTLDGEKVHILDVKVNEEGEAEIKYKIGKSPTVLSDKVGDAGDFVVGENQMPMTGSTITTLFSDYRYTHNRDGFEVISEDLTKDPESILEVADALVEADTHPADEEHNRVLMNQLRTIIDTLVESVPKMVVQLNRDDVANYGQIDVKANEILIESGAGGNKSLLEIYVHELFHAVTHYGISTKDVRTRGITARMENIRDNFIKNVTEERLVEASEGQLSKEDASDLLDYLVHPDRGLHEFVAHSMTNKAVMNVLKTLETGPKKRKPVTLFDKLFNAVVEMFKVISAKVSKEPKGDDFAKMAFLVGRLQNANKKVAKAKHTAGLQNIFSMFDKADNYWKEFLDKLEKKAEKDDDGRLKKEGEWAVTYLVRTAARSLYDKKMRTIYGLGLYGVPGLKPEGTVRSLLKDMMESDETIDAAERLNALSQEIESNRENRARQVANTIRDSFDRPLTANEEVMLTEVVLESDLAAVYFEYGDRIDQILENDKEADKAIKELKDALSEIVSEEVLNRVGYQTQILADYMIEGKDHIALGKNARVIVGKSVEGKDREKAINLVDMIATLEAVKRVNPVKKKAFLELKGEQRNGVDHLVAIQRGEKEHAREVLFRRKEEDNFEIKGYYREFSEDDMEIKIAPKNQEAALKREGFVLKKVLPSHPLSNQAEPMAIYVGEGFIMDTFNRNAMRITGRARKGTTITESHLKGTEDAEKGLLEAQRSINKLLKRRLEVLREMSEGTYKLGDKKNADDSIVSPSIGRSGKVVNFSYGMDKKMKHKTLNIEKRVSLVMGRTAASTYDKSVSESHNEKVMELIDKDAKNIINDSFMGKNLKEYIEINADSPNPEVRDLWNVMPKEVKEKYPEGFKVRRDVMHTLLGQRAMSITDLPGTNLLRDSSTAEVSRLIKHVAKFAEKLWQEIVLISKVDIIIRTPAVFVGNVISNVMLMMMTGHSFRDIVNLKLQGVRELNLYMESVKKGIQYETKDRAGILTKAEQREWMALKNKMASSPVKDLVSEGFYTTINEELDTTASKGWLEKTLNKKMERVPKVVSTGVDILYITNRTPVFKAMERAVQASDFAARYAQYHLMLEKGVKPAAAIKNVRDNFIDYNKPDSRLVEWANKMGFVMFTKYFTRIQRVLGKYGKEHPSKVLLAILGQDLVYELDTIDDQSILTKNLGGLFYTPSDAVSNVLTPSAIEVINHMF